MKKHYIILYKQLKVKTKKRYLKGGLVTNKFSSSYKDEF